MRWFRKLWGRGDDPLPPELMPFARVGAGRHGWLRYTPAGHTAPTIIPLDGDRVILGAAPERYALPADQRIALSSNGVSKVHALLTMTATGYELVDLGSTCGTAVNDRRVVRHLIEDGDYLRIGEATLQLVYLRTSAFARDRPGHLPPRGVPIGAVRGPQCDACAATRCEVKALERTGA